MLSWATLTLAFIVCHLIGDFLFQTDWQATHKHGGLGRDPVARRALASHIATYTLAFLPAVVWICDDRGLGTCLAAIAGIAIPHWLQDHGSLVPMWTKSIKKSDPPPIVLLAVDQTFHVVTLTVLALIIAS